MVRPAREAKALTRADLAVLSGVSESAISKIETARHNPTRPIILRLCKALGLRSPLPGAELRISLGPLDHDTAIRTLRQALRKHIADRADPDAYAKAVGASGVDAVLIAFEAIEGHDNAKHLLNALPNENGDEDRR